MLIGRIKEQQELQRAYNSDEAAFVTVYGRRRVGKTYLVRQFFKDALTFSCSGQATGSMANQLYGWASSLRDAGLRFTNSPNSWLEAFDQLKELIKASPASKKVVFLDELPWFDTPKSGFVNALEFFWNGWASARNDVLLVVCGSATSWIVNKLFRNHGGLHNRVTHRILVEPFTLAECEAYVKSRGFMLTRYDIIEAYMALGGIPFYWSFMMPNKSVAQNIDDLFFADNGVLTHEFEELYHSLFKSPDRYLTLVTALGKHLSGLTRQQITKESGLESNGALTAMLSDLKHCGFIREMSVYGTRSETLYQLIDNFTIFHLKFLADNTARDQQYWSHIYQSPQRAAWTGLAFERVCFQHVNQIKQALGISGVMSSVYAWRVASNDDGERGAQIDMLIDRADNLVNLCEMKFSSDEYVVTEADLRSIRHKASRFSQDKRGRRKSICITMIAACGLSHSAGYWASIPFAISGDDLFNS